MRRWWLPVPPSVPARCSSDSFKRRTASSARLRGVMSRLMPTIRISFATGVADHPADAGHPALAVHWMQRAEFFVPESFPPGCAGLNPGEQLCAIFRMDTKQSRLQNCADLPAPNP